MPIDNNPMAGALPQPTDPRSPALAGQPPSITGNKSALSGLSMKGSPGMAPASPPAGTAQVGGAPLSSNGANERQGGAGANQLDKLDLVKDRGTPEEYWRKNLKTLGSKQALSLMGDAAKGSSGKYGQFAQMDPEEVRRMGTRMNEALGMATPEQQDQIVEELVFTPMADSIKYEVEKGITDEDEGVMRMAMAMAQVSGVENEDALAEILAKARARIGGK